MNPLPPLGRAYVGAIVALGGLVVAVSARDLALAAFEPRWLVLAALTLLSGPFSVKLPSLGITISVSETFVFASALLFGAAPATLTAAIDGLVVSLWARNRRLHRTVFNVAEPAISVWVSTELFYWMSGVPPLYSGPVPIQTVIAPIVAMTVTYFVLTSWLTATAIVLERKGSPAALLRAHLPHLALNFFVTLCLAVLLVQNAQNIDLATAGIVVPILVMSYASTRASMARVEDANRHLNQLNSLYLSTVETLAMAIDAKDQITHGHIRRVQLQTVALGRALGLNDEKELRALEAAALLHDLGKLAVPEHILNKPGRLTSYEYEQMKRHAAIGADILARIDFPYPVAPIVRHHHENWDGSGYPDGLGGDAIPMGARILAVVDCFDAVTSDRPYRRRMTDEEALALLTARRGTMYDPRVVDKFVRVYSTLPGDTPESRESAQSLTRLVAPAVAAPGTAAPPDSLRPIGSTAGDLAALVGRWVEAVKPRCAFAVFAYDPGTDSLAPAAVSGGLPELDGARIALGDRLSGWVAANRTTVANSDPALDLCAPGERLARPLESCLAVPVIEGGGTLLGVLTLYAAGSHAFSEAEIHLVELLARDVLPRAWPAVTTLAATGGRTSTTALIGV
jgi:putative nucleotidyltransferase with HDIG domain